MGRQRVFTHQVSPEHGWVVAVDGHWNSSLDEGSQGMVRHGRNDPGSEIACRRYFQRNPALSQVGKQRGISSGGEAVAHPFGAEHVNRLPDGLGSRCLTSVGDNVKPGIVRPAKCRREIARRMTDFISPETKSNDPRAGPGLDHPVNGAVHRHRPGAGVVDAIGNPAQVDPEHRMHSVPGGVHRGQGIGHSDSSTPLMWFRIEMDLGVPHVLSRKLHPVGFNCHTQIVRRAEDIRTHREDIDEMGEIAELVQAGNLFRITDPKVDTVFLRERPQRVRADGAFEVDVKFDLGHRQEPFGNLNGRFGCHSLTPAGRGAEGKVQGNHIWNRRSGP